VAPPRLEDAATSAPPAASSSGDDADWATKDDATRPAVSASTVDTDEAIRAAAKLAIDAGDTKRARALLDLLDAKPKAAPVLTLAAVKRSAVAGRPRP
jgi:hypothetical protein